MMYCSRCRNIVYCSRRCQKDGWQDHVQCCNFVVSRRQGEDNTERHSYIIDHVHLPSAGYPVPIAAHKIFYMKKAARSDVLKALEDIKSLMLKHKRLHSSEVDHPVVELDYTKDFPYSLTVISADTRTPQNSRKWLQFVVEVVGQSDTVLVYVAVPSGLLTRTDDPDMIASPQYLEPIKLLE